MLDHDFEAAGHERARENHAAGVLTDVDKAASAGESWAKAAHVDVAALIDLCHAETREVQPTAIVEVELLVLVE